MEMGIHLAFLIFHPWIPAFAGMTEGGGSFTFFAIYYMLYAKRYTLHLIRDTDLFRVTGKLTNRLTILIFIYQVCLQELLGQ